MTQVKTAITPTRQENFPEWYQSVVREGQLAENSDVRGCMIILPQGLSLWENIKTYLNLHFKRTNHKNAYFPLLIPKSYLEEEAAHVDGFAKECAVVTHTKLGLNSDGELVPQGKLEEPYIIRPTSETIIGHSFAKWIQSYRDLPVLINQWANVMRWEMRTRIFLRTSEFLWQEGHTAHATREEAVKETKLILDIYSKMASDILALAPFIGSKTEDEKFPGAEITYCLEAMMQDGKALQAGTSHYLGQNFAKAQKIKFVDEQGEHQLAHTTSWGVTTRLIGALIMTHADDNGLIIPPRVAEYHAMIIPIFRNDEEKAAVMKVANELKDSLFEKMFFNNPIAAEIDESALRGGEKFWRAVKKGYPFIIELGPKDIEKNQICLIKRNQENLKDKAFMKIDTFIEMASDELTTMQQDIYQKAVNFRETHTFEMTSKNKFVEFFKKDKKGFISCFAHENLPDEIKSLLKELKVTARCIPLASEEERGTCLFTQKENAKKMIFAKAY